MAKPRRRPASVSTSLVSEQVLRRVRSEFVEMPGLQLTIGQAQRLWGLDEGSCKEILTSLVETKFLRRIGTDRYARIAEPR